MSLDNSICFCSFETDEQIKQIIEAGPHQVEKKYTDKNRWHIFITDVECDVVSIATKSHDDDPEFQNYLVENLGLLEAGQVSFRLTSKMTEKQDSRFLEIFIKLINIPSKPIAGLFNGEEVLIRFDGNTVQIPDKSDFWSDKLLEMLNDKVVNYPIEKFPGPLIL